MSYSDCFTNEQLHHALAKAVRDRDDALASVRECEAEIKDLTIRARKTERDEAEALAKMCQAIGHLSTIAEDCEAWLNGESDEPSMEFVKAVRDYARRAVNQ